MRGGNRLACDNKGTLFTFARKDKRVPPSASNAGVQRVPREVNRQVTSRHILEHVKGHQDNHKRKSQLSLAEKMNTRCDEMANNAVRNAYPNAGKENPVEENVATGGRLPVRGTRETNLGPRENPHIRSGKGQSATILHEVQQTQKETDERESVQQLGLGRHRQGTGSNATDTQALAREAGVGLLRHG